MAELVGVMWWGQLGILLEVDFEIVVRSVRWTGGHCKVSIEDIKVVVVLSRYLGVEGVTICR